ncbi:hypothetical protein [Methylobacterium iners]|uniref:SlyX family protein n=1 Tax=Methylobacterium iners TaxID=418707 RepID=A0ABQ4RX69_9HYPH|nr:hypothetical protein [Methylobacterium iners]GJD94783.1 hypothetical protein OCOJLMKI_1987 [Methylobacterium iners]
MAEVSDAELQALLDAIDALEAKVLAQSEQIDFLLRERIMLREGAAELLEVMPSTSTQEPLKKPPPGHAYGAAGQLILVDLAYK